MKKILIIFLVIFPAFYFGYIGKPTEMGIMVIASSITVAFLNIDKIHKFKGAGFEAEMRKVVNEAYITIDNLKSVALPLITTTIDNISWGKRWGSSESDRDTQMFNELLKIIDELKLDNVEIEDAVNEYYSLKISDEYSKFIVAYKEASRVKGMQAEELNELGKELNALIDIRTYTYPSEKEIIQTIKVSREEFTEEVNESLDKYICFMKEISRKLNKMNIL